MLEYEGNMINFTSNALNTIISINETKLWPSKDINIINHSRLVYKILISTFKSILIILHVVL